jgi:hypothetical protein
MKTHIKNLFFWPALIAGLAWVPSVRVTGRLY